MKTREERSDRYVYIRAKTKRLEGFEVRVVSSCRTWRCYVYCGLGNGGMLVYTGEDQDAAMRTYDVMKEFALRRAMDLEDNVRAVYEGVANVLRSKAIGEAKENGIKEST